MPRNEFTKATKRAALERSRGLCEARGEWYGLKPDTRCYMELAYGVAFDHIILDANSHDNSLANCAAVCKRCHDYKTRTRDIPLAAKTVRQQDKNAGIKAKSSRALPGSRSSGWSHKMNGEWVRR